MTEIASIVALASAPGRAEARDECADEERDEEPQRRSGGSLARLVGGFFCFLLLRLELVERIVHLLLGLLLGQAGALRDQLSRVARVLRRQLSRGRGIREDARDFGRRLLR